MCVCVFYVNVCICMDIGKRMSLMVNACDGVGERICLCVCIFMCQFMIRSITICQFFYSVALCVGMSIYLCLHFCVNMYVCLF